jgi:glycosyltransferase involved in cell wall biosynthesis
MNICMLAYAHYLNDARIKSYVQTLQGYGHQVDVIALRADGENATDPLSTGTVFRVMPKYQGQSTVAYAWSYLKFFLKSAALLTRLHARHRYDAIHVHNMPNALVFAALVPKLLGTQVLLDVHDLMTVNYMAKFNASETALAVKVLKLEQRTSAMFADQVFCADHNQKEYLVRECGLDQSKLTVLMNLPNAELFKKRPARERKKNSPFRIVYHGTIAHRLGIDLMVRAMAKLKNRIPVELWIYGSGDYLAAARGLSFQLGLDAQVHFSGTFFPVEKIPEIVSDMDLGIIANRRNLACDRYMLPVKLLEYVYLGVPVLVPRLAVIDRYFDDSMVQYYEPENVEQMADGIVELFNDPEKRARLAHNAYSFYEKHNIASQADRYVQLLNAHDLSGRMLPQVPA